MKIIKSAVRRGVTCKMLGIVAGLVSVSLAAQTNPEIWAWDSSLMWTILLNRILLAIAILFAGCFTVHPVFSFWRLRWWNRGTILGAVFSLGLAPVALILYPGAWNIFWGIIVTGAFYGFVIDGFATKLGGEGKELLG